MTAAVLLATGFICNTPVGDGPPVVAAPNLDDLSLTGVDVQVLFADTSDGLVALDCIPADGISLGREGPVKACTPFTVTVELPASAEWAAVAVDDVLHRWADEGTPVRFTLLKDVDGPRLRLMADGTRVQLPLAA